MQNPISKITQAKMDEGIAQMVDCLPIKSKALSSNPSNAKGKIKFMFET
jgi:hypothetical protein